MRISIVIPCHNAEAYIAQTLGSLFEQTRLPDEVIVVEDSSTDNSHQIVEKFAGKVILRRKRFGMASKTRNYGASLASGDAIMFLDADDVLGPKALEGLEAGLKDNSEGVCLIPWFRMDHENGRWLKKPPSTPRIRSDEDILKSWLTGHYSPPCCMLWSRKAFERIAGWSEEFCPNDDGDLANRAMVEGIRFTDAPFGEAFYRRIPELGSLSGLRDTPRGLKARLRVIRKIGYWLEERGRLSPYRNALTHAIEEVRTAAENIEDKDLLEECAELQKRVGARAASRTLQQSAKSLRTLPWRTRCAVSNTGRKLLNKPRPEREYEPVTAGLKTANRYATTPVPAIVELTNPKLSDRRPKVSVIIPTYNRAKIVPRAIQSVLDQSFKDFEILLVDDASTDNTAEVVNAIGDSRIRYLLQHENGDVSAARNRGLREALGEYIAFLDSDDEWLPTKLAKQVALFDSLPESVGAIYTGAETRFLDGHVTVSHPSDRGNVLRPLLSRNITDKGSGSVIIRRNVVRVVGFFDEEIPAMEDYDYWIRIARFYDFEFIDEPLIRYYDDNRSDQRSLMRKADIDARKHLFAKYSEELKANRLTDSFLLNSARRRLRRIKPPDRAGAFALTLKAFCNKPTNFECYRLFYQSVFPEKLRQASRSTVKKLVGSGSA